MAQEYTEEQAMGAIKNAHAAGDNAAVNEWANYLDNMKGIPIEAAAPEQADPEQEQETSFGKGFVEGESWTQQAGDLVGAVTGMAPLITYRDEDGYGLGYKSTEEIYGEGFADASFDERRKMITDERARKIEEDYGDVEGSTFGNIAGMLFDPTTALPVGATYKGMAAIGGAIGGTYSVTDQLLNKGSVDPVEAGLHSIAGAVLAPVGGYVFNKVGSKISQKVAVKSANKAIDDVNTYISHHISLGATKAGATKIALERTGLTPDGVTKAEVLANRTVHIPKKAEAVALKEVGNKVKATSNLFEGISSRIKEHSPRLWQVLRSFEEKQAIELSTRKKEYIDPFIKTLKGYTQKELEPIHNHLMNREFGAADTLMTQLGKGGNAELKKLSKMMRADGKKFEKIVGNNYKALNNYFPRKVKDVEGLRIALGRKSTKAASSLDKHIKAAIANEGVKTEQQLSSIGMTDAVSKAINTAYYPKVVAAGKGQRTVSKVPLELMKYYEDPATSLLRYVESSTRTFGKTELLGKGLSQKRNDPAAQLYRVLGEEKQRGRISETQFDDIKELVRARFTTGEQAMGSSLAAVKDIGYMASLGQLRSAATQIKDLGTSAYLHGVMPTIKGALSVRSNILDKTGLADTVSAEMATSQGTTKLLNSVLKLSMFRAVDRFGKRTLLEASRIKGTKLASSPKGVAILRKKYGEAYGNDFDNLVTSLKNGTDDELTSLYRFHELSDTQPVSLLEMPKMYLDMPNGRIFFALKSFALKQLTLLHNDIIKRGKGGDKKGAALALTRYAAMIGIAGGTVDEAKEVMAGGSFDLEEIPEKVKDNLLSMVFLSKFTIGDISKGDFSSVVGDLVTPSVAPLEATIQDTVRYYNGVPIGESEQPVNLIKTFPVIGRIIYDLALGGKEKDEERKQRDYMESLRE